MKKKILLSVLLCTTLACLPVRAQQYQSEHLRAAATKLHLDTLLTNVSQPDTYMFKIGEQSVVVRIGKNGKVEHIGLPLFHQSLRALQPSPIYDYLEFAALDQLFEVSDNRLKLTELTFVMGDWALLRTMNDTVPCAISNLENKLYKVSWKRDGQDVVVVSFPVNYELLANSSRREMEANFVRDLKTFSSDRAGRFMVDTLLLQPYTIEGVKLLKGDQHFIPAITSNLYVQVGKDASQQLLINNSYPAETLANLLVADAATVDDASIQLEFVLYNFSKETFVVSLNDWKAFCRSQGCQPYFGFEGVGQGEARATVFLSNPQSGYDHIVYLTCPTHLIGQEGMQLKAKVFLFAPMSNVRSLFGEHFNQSGKSYVIWR